MALRVPAPLNSGGYLSPGRCRSSGVSGPSPSPTPRQNAPWVQRAHSYEPPRLLTGPGEQPATARQQWNNTQEKPPRPSARGMSQRTSSHPHGLGVPASIVPSGSMRHHNSVGSLDEAVSEQHWTISAEKPWAMSGHGGASAPAAPPIPEDRVIQMQPKQVPLETIVPHDRIIKQAANSASTRSLVLSDEITQADIKEIKSKVDRIAEWATTKQDSLLAGDTTKELNLEEKRAKEEAEKKNVELLAHVQQLKEALNSVELRLAAEQDQRAQVVQQRDEYTQKCAQLQTALEEKALDKKKMDEMQAEHNQKVSDYLEQMIVQHNAKVDNIAELEQQKKELEQQTKELTAQLKDEKGKHEAIQAKRRSEGRELKEMRARESLQREQTDACTTRFEELKKEKENAMKECRKMQASLKSLESEKAEIDRNAKAALDRERDIALDKERQLEADKARLKEQLTKVRADLEQANQSAERAVTQALRTRNAEVGDIEQRYQEAKHHNEALRADAEQARSDKSRVEQVLAEERHEAQVNQLQVKKLKQELERRDGQENDHRRKYNGEMDKENMRLQQTVTSQKALLWDLENQLRQERSASSLLSPGDAARILKVGHDSLGAENSALQAEICALRSKLEAKPQKPQQMLMLQTQQRLDGSIGS